MAALEVVERPGSGGTSAFQIAQAPRSGAVVARLDGAVVTRGDFTLGPLTLENRVGRPPGPGGIEWLGQIDIGPSHIGSTPPGRRIPMDGAERGGRRARTRASRLSGSGTVVDALMERSGAPLPEARSLLAKFGLGADAVNRPTSSLSPGERTRAELAAFGVLGVNFLVLDEPTNHLDPPAIEQLESALGAFDGTLSWCHMIAGCWRG